MPPLLAAGARLDEDEEEEDDEEEEEEDFSFDSLPVSFADSLDVVSLALAGGALEVALPWAARDKDDSRCGAFS